MRCHKYTSVFNRFAGKDNLLGEGPQLRKPAVQWHQLSMCGCGCEEVKKSQKSHYLSKECRQFTKEHFSLVYDGVSH